MPLSRNRLKYLILCFIFAALPGQALVMAGSSGPVSILETDADLKARFGKSAAGLEVLLDENFETNDFKWPQGRWEGRSAKVSGGQYKLNISTWKKCQFTRPVSLPGSDKEILMETRFTIDDSSHFPLMFGLVWDVEYGFEKKRPDNSDHYTNKQYAWARVVRDGSGSTGYKKGKFENDTIQFNTSSESPKGPQTFVLSVLKTKRRIQVYLNGKKVNSRNRPPITTRGRMGFMTKGSFEYKSRAKILVDSFRVLAAPKPEKPLKSISAEFEEYRSAKKSGALFKVGETVVDLRNNRVWMAHGYAARKDYYKLGNLYYGTAEKWINILNRERTQGFTNWRIPSVDEYKTIYTSRAGFIFTDSFTKAQSILGYVKPIYGSAPWAWASEHGDDWAMAFDFIHGHKIRINHPPRHFSYIELVPVRDGPLDLFALLLAPPKKTASQLSGNQMDILSRFTDPPDRVVALTDAQKQIFERVKAAYDSGIDESGQMLFDVLADQAAPALFQEGYTRRTAGAGLPLALAGKILLNLLDTHKDKAAFWFEYGHLAMLANQPALVFQAAEKLPSVSGPEFLKEEILDQATLFEAAAHMLMGDEKKAYAALLMRLELKQNILVPYYINSHARVLLKDKAKLAAVTGMDPAMFALGQYEEPKPQAFYNLKTGKRISPIADVQPLASEKKASGKKRQPTASGGATVLD